MCSCSIQRGPLRITKPIDIKATGTMPYQFVKTETTLDEDKWVQGYEILPTDRSVVHHVIVNVHEKGIKRARDREQGIGGYWAAYVPGKSRANVSGRLCKETVGRCDGELPDPLHTQWRGDSGATEDGINLC